MPKTSKNTKGESIVIVEIYPEDISDSLLPGDLETLKDKYGDRPCSYEVHYPWKKNPHFTWFVEDVYAKYAKTHRIVRQKESG